MSRHRPATLLGLLLMAGALAGCVGSAGDKAALLPVDAGEAEVLPGDRPVADATTWHEELHETTPSPLAGTFIIENKWEPRDVDLTYHGVQPVYDEWGRVVPAHIYRYEPMSLEVTSVEFTIESLTITARYEPTYIEYAFAESDGHLVGITELEEKVRGFADHRWPSPLVGGYEMGLLLGVTYASLGGDLSQPIPDAFGDLLFNATDLRPLAGDCQPYELEHRPAPWYQAWMDESASSEPPTPKLPEDEQHELVCIEEDGQPLWAYSGNASDHLRIERTGPDLALPVLQGEVLAARSIQARSFEPLPLLLGLAKPIAVPPSASPGDWADQVRPVIEGIGTGADYVQWQLQREALYLLDISKAFPYGGVGLTDLPRQLGLPTPTFEETSWVFVGDGNDMFWAFVDSRYGGPEDPDLHMSQRGAAFDDYPSTVRDVVASGEVQAYWESEDGPLLPPEPGFLSFSTFPDFFDNLPAEYVEYLLPFLTTWSAMEYCWEDRDDGRFAAFSAINGQMAAMGSQTSTANGCSTGGADGDGFVRLPLGRHEALFSPRQPGRPALFVVPDLGLTLVGAGHED